MKRNKKYKLVKRKSIVTGNGTILYRIKALKDFGNVKKGEIGGFVKSENNLSQEGNCWIHDEAKVLDNAMVLGNAQVSGYATLKDYATVSDSACIKGSNVLISGKSHIYGAVIILDNSKITGECNIGDNVKIYNSSIFNSLITGPGYISISIIISSILEDFAKIEQSKLNYSSVINGSSVDSARIENVTMLDGAVVKNVSIKNAVLGKEADISSVSDLITINQISAKYNPDETCNGYTFYLSKDKDILACNDNGDVVTLDSLKDEIGKNALIKESDKKLYDLAITYVKSHFDYINSHK